MKINTKDESFSDEETTKRREEALKNMLSTPHKPHVPDNEREAKARPVRRSKKKSA